MSSLIASVALALSQAALSVIAKIVGKEFFEAILIRLLVTGAKKLAEKTDSHSDDELVELLAERLGVQILVYRKPDSKQ